MVSESKRGFIMELFHKHSWVYSDFTDAPHGGEVPSKRVCSTCGREEVMISHLGWTRLKKHVWKTSDGEKHSFGILDE